MTITTAYQSRMGLIVVLITYVNSFVSDLIGTFILSFVSVLSLCVTAGSGFVSWYFFKIIVFLE